MRANGIEGLRNCTLSAWGRDEDGQLCLGDTVDRDEPTQVGGDTDWSPIA